MLMIITNKTDATADYLIDRLKEKELPFFRFNVEEFPQAVRLEWSHNTKRCKRVLYTIKGQKLPLSVIRSVWWRRPYEIGPQIDPMVKDKRARDFAELQSREGLEMLWSDLEHCLWVNNPQANKRANSKLLQLRAASEIGLNTPSTLLTNDPNLVREFVENAPGRVVIKTLRQKPIEIGEECYGFYTSIVSKKHLQWVESVKYAPVLLQYEIPKKKELRITLVGDEVHTASLDRGGYEEYELDWRKEDPLKQDWQAYKLPGEIRRLCLILARKLGLQFGAIDMIVTPKGEYVFLEINPNGQWAWLEIEAGLPISDSLINLFYG